MAKKTSILNKKVNNGLFVLIVSFVIILGILLVAMKASAPGSITPNAPESQPKAYERKSVGKPTPPKSTYKCTPQNCPAPQFYCYNSTNCLSSTPVKVLK